MSSDLTINGLIDKYNILKEPTEQVSRYMRENPTLYKAALLANHVFRAISMTALCFFLPFSLPVNIAICFAGSLFYRLTVETNCAYKFALPACAGAVALPMAAAALTSLISGVAFASIGAFAIATLSVLPLAAYLTYIVVTVNHDVDKQCQVRRP